MNGSKGHKQQTTKNAHPNNIASTLTAVTQREETKNPQNLPGGCTCGVPASLRGAKPGRREPELEQRCLPWQCTPASRCRTFSSGSASRPEVTVKQDMLCICTVLASRQCCQGDSVTDPVSDALCKSTDYFKLSSTIRYNHYA